MKKTNNSFNFDETYDHSFDTSWANNVYHVCAKYVRNYHLQFFHPLVSPYVTGIYISNI